MAQNIDDKSLKQELHCPVTTTRHILPIYWLDSYFLEVAYNKSINFL